MNLGLKIVTTIPFLLKIFDVWHGKFQIFKSDFRKRFLQFMFLFVVISEKHENDLTFFRQFKKKTYLFIFLFFFKKLLLKLNSVENLTKIYHL